MAKTKKEIEEIKEEVISTPTENIISTPVEKEKKIEKTDEYEVLVAFYNGTKRYEAGEKIIPTEEEIEELLRRNLIK